jgi:site-specific DNA-methyltransferase (adenine-specific)
MSIILPPVNTVVQGDVAETLRSWPNSFASMIVADPAYGTNLKTVSWDAEPGYKVEWLAEAYRVLKPGGVCYTFGKPEIILRYLDLFPEPRRVIVWHYQNKTQPRAKAFQSTWDAVIMFSKGEPRFFRDPIRQPYTRKYRRLLNKQRSAAPGRFGKKHSFYEDRGGTLPRDVIIGKALTGRSSAKERSGHPTQKPLWLMEKLVLSASLPDEIVLDLFAGGGTTSVAAKRLGRQWIAVEREAAYCDIITVRTAAIPGGDVQTKIRVDSSQASKSYSNPAGE